MLKTVAGSAWTVNLSKRSKFDKLQSKLNCTTKRLLGKSCVFVCVCVCMCAFVCVCMYVHVPVHEHVYVVCLHAYTLELIVWVRACVCMHVFKGYVSQCLCIVTPSWECLWTLAKANEALWIYFLWFIVLIYSVALESLESHTTVV